MPEEPVVTSSTAANPYTARPPFACSWKAEGLDSAWVDVAGELDLATAPRLRQALGDAQHDARLVVLDLRELVFMDSGGVHLIIDAADRARQEGGCLTLLRPLHQVDWVLRLTGASQRVLIDL